LLDIYTFSEDDIDEIKKILKLIDSGSIEIVMTQQVQDEFERNRPAKIKSAISELESPRFGKFPQICRSYEEYKSLSQLEKQYESLRKTLKQKIQDDYCNKTLRADLFLTEFFEKANLRKITPEITQKSQVRINRGNPPGKKGSLGDAINWELLLSYIPEGKDLYFISYDSDFASPMVPKVIHEFLEGEWKEEKFSEIHYYNRLSAFFTDCFPDIKLIIDQTRQEKVETLIHSADFRTTHKAIQSLSPELNNLSEGQIYQIIIALENNDQIYMINSDPDIEKFFADLYSSHQYGLSVREKEILQHWYSSQITRIDNEDVIF